MARAPCATPASVHECEFGIRTSDSSETKHHSQCANEVRVCVWINLCARISNEWRKCRYVCVRATGNTVSWRSTDDICMLLTSRLAIKAPHAETFGSFWLFSKIVCLSSIHWSNNNNIVASGEQRMAENCKNYSNALWSTHRCVNTLPNGEHLFARNIQRSSRSLSRSLPMRRNCARRIVC